MSTTDTTHGAGASAHEAATAAPGDGGPPADALSGGGAGATPDAPSGGGAGVPPDAPAGGGAGVPPRSVAALVTAGVVVVGVVALVLVFGVARPPELPSLAEQPDPAPPASVAWTRWDEGFACVDTLAPEGTVAEVACDLQGEELLAWDADGIAMWVWGPREMVEILDPTTGEVVDTRPASGHLLDERPMDALRVRHEDGTLTATMRDTGAVLWEVDAHENYRLREGRVSPDGEWVAAFDSAGRLLVAPTDGSVEPRVWHETEEHWQAPVWEGTPLPEVAGD